MNAEALPILTNRSFWPRPAYARPWVFKDSPLSAPATLEVDPQVSERTGTDGDEKAETANETGETQQGSAA